MDVLSQALLNPRSVAVVGASDNPAKATGRPQRFLAQAGYEGRAYFVNPRRETVQGEKAWPSLTALPEAPEHVYIMTGAEAAIEAVRECARTGVRVATILSAGFGEDGEAGREREDRLRAAAAEGQVRLVGPSSLGVVNPRTGVMLTGNAAFGEPDIPRGGVFVASQSGSVIGSLVSRARGRGIGFAGLVSTGGEADLSLGTICRAVLDDPGVTSYALFLESLRHADDLADFAAAADRAGKPVAVYKLGRSQEAAALTVSHTGALAGEDSESEAFFTACGFSRVTHFESLLEAPALLRRLPVPACRREARVGVITTTGGGGAIVVDQLAVRGLTVTAPSERLRAAMAAAGVPVPHSLIADIGLEGARHDSVTSALRLMQDSGEFDLIVFVIGSSARLNPELAVHAIAERGGHPVPVAAFALPEAAQAAELLHAAGVPAFRTPESCADVVAAAFARQPATIGDRARPAVVVAPDTASVLDELASAELLRGQGVTAAPAVGLDLAALLDSSGPLDLPFDYPVVVKALSGELPHKSDAGGVVLNVQDADGIRDAARTIAAAVAAHDPDIVIDRVLVQQMVGSGVAEALVGYRVSQDVGPVVVLSTGGVLAELFADSAVRLAPVTRETALEMIREVKGLAPLSGHRGAPAGDIDALADTVVGISRLAVDHPGVLEAEANPVSVGLEGKGVTALDALVRRTPARL
ncbi:acetate--CoA ligase family protein [Streptomyces roseirectus]|uniref:Acetate--CoA ligase family protein n=1 Tax=Streptomyces roseirectus TaxID=2768066 RepID=A0A7H0IQ47_9ACTN|nr:acetate--CoA ligase family protein [Streptomyces roseirectus]QNP74913.1 acetate--CoA ligase family protein [Streptomyces roseirectus]